MFIHVQMQNVVGWKNIFDLMFSFVPVFWQQQREITVVILCLSRGLISSVIFMIIGNEFRKWAGWLQE